jgi:protein gp37
MSATSSIEWTDKTWNPVRGCSVVSPGCVNCYAMKQAHRQSGPGRAYEGLTKMTKAGAQWTGVVRTVESALLEPLSWRKPQRVFVNSMSDLFHEDVPDVFIDRVFAVMAWCDRHTFQILTKRADRTRDYMDGLTRGGIDATARRLASGGGALRIPSDTPTSGLVWPLPNVWLGVSVEDQKHADLRIPLLLQTPAAVRFISAEPLLAALNLRPYLTGFAFGGAIYTGPRLDWVIVGGESGHSARPFDLVWARSIVKQCKAAGIGCFVKQLGAWTIDGTPMVEVGLRNRKGGDPSEWPDDLRVREFPEVRR